MINCQFESGNKASLRHVTVGVLMLDTTKSNILLVKRSPRLSNPNKWAIPGGFLGRDETTSQCVMRETLEETGYEVTIDVLFRVNDNPLRPQEDRQNVDFVYIAQAVKKTQEPDNESSQVKWIPLNKLPSENEWAFDHGETVMMYKKHLKEKFPLPVVNNLAV